MVHRTEVSISQQGIWRYSSEKPRWEETVPALSSKLTWMRKGGPDSLRRASVRSDVSRSLQRSIVSCSQFTPPSYDKCNFLDHPLVAINKILSHLQLRCDPQKESKDGAETSSGTMMVVGGTVTPGLLGSGAPGIVSSTIRVKKHCAWK